MNALKARLFRTCPKSGKIVGVRQPEGWARLWFPVVGLAALLWFLLRVVPKPSRAAYPCQRVAMPLASGFVLWLAGMAGASLAIGGARRQFRQAHWLSGGLAVVIALVGVGWAMVSVQNASLASALPERVEYTPHPANQPIGVAKGLAPGRVVWVHDPAVTNWQGPSASTLWYDAVDQGVASAMMSQSLRSYAGATTDTAAWDAIFRSFNSGDPYQAGEKIFIKINLTTSNYGGNGTGCSTTGYDQRYHPNCWGVFNYSIGPSPQVIYALLHQLVNVAGVAQGDITIGDSTGVFVNHLYNPLAGSFPNVRYLDKRGAAGRTLATLSTTRLYWSTTEDDSNLNDYLLQAAADATYNINLAILKSHDRNGITVTAKNHYGSFLRTPDPGTGNNYYNLHNRLPMQGTWGQAGSLAQYRPLVDLNGHAGMGGKTLLHLLDGIYGGWNWLSAPSLWNQAPFNSDWPSSFFLSMDPVVIDSVAFDLLSQQWPQHALANEGVQDYLHEMAQANSPPSATFYDPEGDGTRLASMGVHEHWNNPVEKKYSRNLGTGNGIELVYVSNGTPPAPAACVGATILFVTSSTSPVPAADQALITQLGAAGFVVTPRAQSAAVTADAFGQDLVIISDSVDSGTVGVKFRDVAVPVILWENALFDDMQMTSTTSGTHFGGAASQTQVNVINGGHPMAAGLSGLVTTTSTNKSYSWGVPASGADTIATLAGNSSRATVFAYETGVAMFAGTTSDKSGVVTPAPARRVGFFSGDSLTSDGNKLFDAAVQWAAQCSDASGLTLINGSTGEELGPLVNGQTVNLAELPTQNINIRADVDPAVLGSVGFTYDGNVNYRTDNSAPYTLVEPGTVHAPEWTPEIGSHTLTVTPYAAPERGGRAGQGLAINFTVSNTPLAITLASFAAQQQGDAVQVTWETTSELNHAGFNLYRALAADGERTLLAYVPSSAPGSSAGAAYSVHDDDVTAGQTYWYWLEDVDLSGVTSLHGPVSVAVQVPTAVALASFGASAPQPPARTALPLLLAALLLLAGAAALRRLFLTRHVEQT